MLTCIIISVSGRCRLKCTKVCQLSLRSRSVSWRLRYSIACSPALPRYPQGTPVRSCKFRLFANILYPHIDHVLALMS